jgi:hypothetical protein
VPPPGYVPPPGAASSSPAGPTPPASPSPASPPRSAGGAAVDQIRSRRPGPRKLIAAGLGLAAAVAAVLVLFGSTSNQVTDPVAQAATVSASTPGYRINMSLSMNLSALGAPVLASGTGVVDPPAHAASMSMTMDFSQVPQVAQALGGTTVRIAMIIDGQNVFEKLPQALLDKVPGLAGKSWLEVNLAKYTGVPGLSSLGSGPATGDPAQLLRYLRASGGVTDEGAQVVDGVPTTHYRAELNLLGQSDIPVDVWVDAHHLVRRIVMSITLGADGQSVQEAITADLSDYGPQSEPTPPPADQVQSLTSLAAAVAGAGS